MISYRPFYETLFQKGVTEYHLIFKEGVTANTLHRMKHGKPITTTTLNTPLRDPLVPCGGYSGIRARRGLSRLTGRESGFPVGKPTGQKGYPFCRGAISCNFYHTPARIATVIMQLHLHFVQKFSGPWVTSWGRRFFFSACRGEGGGLPEPGEDLPVQVPGVPDEDVVCPAPG